MELAWGASGGGNLRTFRKAYVEKMAKLRHGDPTGCPHEVLDPRDLKFHRNLHGLLAGRRRPVPMGARAVTASRVGAWPNCS